MADETTASLRRSPWFRAGIALAIAPVNFGVWLLAVTQRPPSAALIYLFWALAVLQVLLGLVAIVAGVRQRWKTRCGGIAAAFGGLVAVLGGLAGGLYGTLIAMFAAGGGWGRPLRVRGRQLHPELREGSDWTEGARPDASSLDADTALALEALWLHDAQKEHASVPAFSRVSWLLAAAGAPAELLVGSHRAALEEIEHARLCFALAAGYGGRSHTVEPMPELLASELGVRGNVLVLLMRESLADGCLLEDFNADIAAECAVVCEEPATRAVLEQIAREERSHAELSWAIVQWTLQCPGDEVARAAVQAIEELGRYQRPTAVGWRKQSLVNRADQAALRRHGRLPDARWAEVWQQRLRETRARAHDVLARTNVAAERPAAAVTT
ncbi:MAG TPA: hypothetical protein VF384_08325 [Planctomycetota bacterium]